MTNRQGQHDDLEFTLKALLRSIGIDPPRIHDVSDVLVAERERLPGSLMSDLETLTQASRQLRRDRELAFYGAEDLTPSGFYSREDGERSRAPRSHPPRSAAAL